MPVRCGETATLPPQGSAIEAGHVRLGTGLIEKHKSIDLGETPGKPEAPPGEQDVDSTLLRGDQRLFLKVSLSFCNARHTVDSATGTLIIDANSRNVIPGCWATVVTSFR